MTNLCNEEIPLLTTRLERKIVVIDGAKTRVWDVSCSPDIGEGASSTVDVLPESVCKLIYLLDTAGVGYQVENIGVKLSDTIYWLHRNHEATAMSFLKEVGETTKERNEKTS